jgi:hypothetical protein
MSAPGRVACILVLLITPGCDMRRPTLVTLTRDEEEVLTAVIGEYLAGRVKMDSAFGRRYKDSLAAQVLCDRCGETERWSDPTYRTLRDTLSQTARTQGADTAGLRDAIIALGRPAFESPSRATIYVNETVPCHGDSGGASWAIKTLEPTNDRWIVTATENTAGIAFDCRER